MDEKIAQEKRARNLRSQIASIVKSGRDRSRGNSDSDPVRPKDESPREFIHRRMQEIEGGRS